MGAFEFAPAPVPDELVASYHRLGHTSDLTFPALLLRNRRDFGRVTAAVESDVVLSWAELVDAAAQFGGFLQANGIGAGDVVAWQLPNWWESLVVAHGILAAGAISAPIVPIYREHELRQIVAAVRPTCVLAPAEFRGVDHVALISEACRDVGWQPRARVVLRGTATGWTAFDDTLRASPFVDVSVDPDEPAIIGFTSGTTSGAKGVVHSSRSYLAISTRAVRTASWGWDDRAYMPAPVAHITGLLAAVTIPAASGCTVVLRDRWDAERAVDDFVQQGITFSAGAAVFVQELLAAMRSRGIERLPLPGGYLCGGSTVPPALAEAAEAAGLHPSRSYGMTECPCVSGPDRSDPAEIRLYSDGRVAPGNEIRVVADGADVGPGEVGEFVVRGPQRALGYIDPAHTRDGFDADGWFSSGDLGVLDGDVLTVTGRVKEIINRGGEKISGREIEDALIRHPAVAEAAVVPAPHERLGEQPAAFVLTRPGATATNEELAAFLHQAGLAPQKVPRIWRQVSELPRTPSGKVKKYVLQAELVEETSAGR